MDTHVLLWSLLQPERMPEGAAALLQDIDEVAYFGVVSVIELASKRPLAKLDFVVDMLKARQELVSDELHELQSTSAHTVALTRLPLVDRDPFGRLLLAQATTEDLTLLTVDKKLATYGVNVCLLH